MATVHFYRTLAQGLLTQLVLTTLSAFSGAGVLVGVAAETGIRLVGTTNVTCGHNIDRN